MKRIIPIIILLAAIGGGYWWFNQPAATALEPATGPAALVGSGTIEAETVAVTAELGGRVIELKVDEGDEVEAGQVLVELDKADLLAQQIQLEAAVTTAKTNLELVSAPARSEDIAMAQAQLTQVRVALEGARQTWEENRRLINNPHELEARVNQARAAVTLAESNLEMAQVNLKRMDVQAEAAGRNQSSHAALVQNDVAQFQLQAAQVGLQMAEVAVDGTKRQVEHLEGMRDLPLPFIIQANTAEAAYHQAEAAVLVAEANLVAVKADPTAEDIAVARAQALEAEAIVAAVEVQLAKQTLIAPRDGLITQKLINSGELAAPGAVLLELSDIDTVDLTVYIPETRIGEVKIGHRAMVYVDAYDDDQFEGRVSFIAHEAEFTPRNVQTQEERVNLVFAVKITLNNADHRLKPGMPADAEILSTSAPEQIEASSPSSSSQTTSSMPTATSTRPNAPTATPTLADTPTVIPTPTDDGAATFTPPPADGSAPTQVEVITWWLNVRSGPGPDFPIVATLAQGDTVPVVDVDPETGWLQVQLPAGEEFGWVSGSQTYVSVR